MATYRSEIHIPVQHDDMNFKERQIKTWDNMETQMGTRQKKWESDFDVLRKEFFTLAPAENATTAAIARLDNMKTVYETNEAGEQMFKVRFEVKEFKAEEIQVKVQENKVIVQAKHEEKSANRSVSKEYTRQVDIPSHVDEDRLQCILSKDGILTVEAPVKKAILAGEKESTLLPIRQGFVNTTPTKMNFTNEPIAMRSPIITEADGTRKLKLEVDVGEFKPEEVVVKTIDKKVLISATHEEIQSGKKLTKSFNKEYELPDTVDPISVNAYMQGDGKLIIEAPLKSQPKSAFTVTQTHDTRRVVVTRESKMSSQNTSKPIVTISVHRRA